ncbi:glycosyltransferase family 39 protein [Streptomyces sp. NBC_00038]|uniref:glycosyltransferase family 39 protein n=1 Tax=Streptomyces sp. NBC_00038 TaxID=2903615 RepID=UPI0022558BF4|nr:glycosyltransferase family 39 protein [Streptomyces sp. NBC_00038]MCX5560293.1 glycosyltransferase family 39 protein [Streptomyces sp. NBC_00038]
MPSTRRRPPSPTPTTPTALRRVAPALLAYVAVRAVGLLVLAAWAHRQGHGVWPVLATRWDADWYLGIAGHGYARELGTAYDANNLAFFPLYPVLVKAVAAVTPGSAAGAGLGIAVVASLFAAWGVFAVGDRLYGRRVGVLLTVLWAALPVGLVQWMGYTESLFTAFAAWSLYAVLSGRWLWAGALASLAGLTRPTGVAVAAAVTVTALASLRRRFDARVLAAAVLAPLGWLGYVGWVGLRLGRWDGYFAVQRLWHNEFDGGLATLRRMREYLMYDSTPELFLLMVTATLVASVLLFALAVWDRQPLPLLLFTGLLLVIVLGSGGVYFPRARFLLPAFPLLLPLAVHLSRASLRFRVLTLAAAVLGAAYFGAYMALVWPSAP